LLSHAGLNLCAILDITSQLTTSCIDVITTGFTNRGHQTCVLQLLGKRLNTGMG
jgi:hypothetical protein